MPKEIPCPASIIERTDENGIVISYKWKTGFKTIVMLFIGCGWIIFDSFLAKDIFKEGVLGILFLIAHMSFGFPLLYIGIAYCFNSTFFAVSKEKIQIRHYPIPWRGNKVILVSEMKNLFFTEEEKKDSYGRITKYFYLKMTLQDGTQITLCNQFTTAQEAMYVEQRIKEILHC